MEDSFYSHHAAMCHVCDSPSMPHLRWRSCVALDSNYTCCDPSPLLANRLVLSFFATLQRTPSAQVYVTNITEKANKSPHVVIIARGESHQCSHAAERSRLAPIVSRESRMFTTEIIRILKAVREDTIIHNSGLSYPQNIDRCSRSQEHYPVSYFEENIEKFS